jgi:galactonate dehydratase
MNASSELHYIDTVAWTKLWSALDLSARRSEGLWDCGRFSWPGASVNGKIIARRLIDLTCLSRAVLSDTKRSLKLRDTPRHCSWGRLFRAGISRFFALGVVDVVQPDVSHAGGISETHRIGTMAEAYDVTVPFTARSDRSRSLRAFN